MALWIFPKPLHHNNRQIGLFNFMTLKRLGQRRADFSVLATIPHFIFINAMYQPKSPIGVGRQRLQHTANMR